MKSLKNNITFLARINFRKRRSVQLLLFCFFFSLVNIIFAQSAESLLAKGQSAFENSDYINAAKNIYMFLELMHGELSPDEEQKLRTVLNYSENQMNEALKLMKLAYVRTTELEGAFRKDADEPVKTYGTRKRIPMARPSFPTAINSTIGNKLAGTIRYTNLALGKPAYQSTTDYNGQPARAVDGNTDGNYSGNSVTHTAQKGIKWWEVNLVEYAYIDRIEIWNRTDCCSQRLNKLDIYVSDQSSASLHKKDQGQQYWKMFNDWEIDQVNFHTRFDKKINWQAGKPLIVPVNNSGRFVSIRLSNLQKEALSLAEVKVFGKKSAPQPKLKEITFQNHTYTDLTLYRVDKQTGREQFQDALGRFAANKTIKVSGYEGERWVFRDAANGKFVQNSTIPGNGRKPEFINLYAAGKTPITIMAYRGTGVNGPVTVHYIDEKSGQEKLYGTIKQWTGYTYKQLRTFDGQRWVFRDARKNSSKAIIDRMTARPGMKQYLIKAKPTAPQIISQTSQTVKPKNSNYGIRFVISVSISCVSEGFGEDPLSFGKGNGSEYYGQLNVGFVHPKAPAKIIKQFQFFNYNGKGNSFLRLKNGVSTLVSEYKMSITKQEMALGMWTVWGWLKESDDPVNVNLGSRKWTDTANGILPKMANKTSTFRFSSATGDKIDVRMSIRKGR